jgi:hypothetical protein
MLPTIKLNRLFHHTPTPYDPDPVEHVVKRVFAAYEIDRLLIIAQGMYMPRKAKNTNGRDWQVQFSSLKLSKSDKKDFEAWAKDIADDLFYQYYPDLLQQAIKCSMSYDAGNDCFIFSMTCKDPKSPNHNVCMVSRSGSHEEAMLIGLYKHLVICNNGVWPVQGEDDWG